MSKIASSDIVTVYTALGGGSFDRRYVSRVSIKYTDSFIEKTRKAILYVPLCLSRGLIYVDKEKFLPQKKHIFTLCVGQLIVPYKCENITPPTDAMMLQLLEKRSIGSRRLHHIKATLFNIVQEEEE